MPCLRGPAVRTPVPMAIGTAKACHLQPVIPTFLRKLLPTQSRTSEGLVRVRQGSADEGARRRAASRLGPLALQALLRFQTDAHGRGNLQELNAAPKKEEADRREDAAFHVLLLLDIEEERRAAIKDVQAQTEQEPAGNFTGPKFHGFSFR